MLQFQFDMLGLGDHLEDLNHTGNNVIQIQILRHYTQTACLTLRPLQQVIQQIMHFLRFLIGLIDQVEQLRADGFGSD